MSKAVVPISGGLDSSVILSLAAGVHDEIYGVVRATKICDIVPHPAPVGPHRNEVGNQGMPELPQPVFSRCAQRDCPPASGAL